MFTKEDFLPNKSTDLYFRMVENRLANPITDRYCEWHHIIPECFGGSNENSNFVHFTGQEHLTAHRLLVKMLPDGWRKDKMIDANIRMASCNVDKDGNEKYRVTGRQFEEARKMFAEKQRRRNADPEVKKQQSETMTKLWEDPDYYEKMCMVHKISHNTEEYKKKSSERMLEYFSIPENLEAHRERLQDPEYRKQLSQNKIEWFSNPENKQKHYDATHTEEANVRRKEAVNKYFNGPENRVKQVEHLNAHLRKFENIHEICESIKKGVTLKRLSTENNCSYLDIRREARTYLGQNEYKRIVAVGKEVRIQSQKEKPRNRPEKPMSITAKKKREATLGYINSTPGENIRRGNWLNSTPKKKGKEHHGYVTYSNIEEMAQLFREKNSLLVIAERFSICRGTLIKRLKDYIGEETYNKLIQEQRKLRGSRLPKKEKLIIPMESVQL